MITATSKMPIFFARKFEPVICHSVLDKIDDWISEKSKDKHIDFQVHAHLEHSSRTRYWQSMYHHLDMSPEPDLVMVKVAEALCMLACDTLLNDKTTGIYGFVVLHEISSYHKDDILQGFLVRFTIKRDKWNKKGFEVFVQRNVNAVHKKIEFRKGEFEVGTNFDVKEKIFRNFLNVMDENSEPVLMYSFDGTTGKEDEGFIMKAAWIDPKGDVAYVIEKSISNASVDKQIFHPQLNISLMSGVWTIVVINQQTNHLLCRIQFLVFPTQNIDESNAALYNVSLVEQLKILKIAHESETKREKKLLEINRNLTSSSSNKELLFNQLVNDFYTLVSICSVENGELINQNKKDPNQHISLCNETVWSSLSPDPKSDISRFDKELKLLI